jgi:hypothetical protein
MHPAVRDFAGVLRCDELGADLSTRPPNVVRRVADDWQADECINNYGLANVSHDLLNLQKLPSMAEQTKAPFQTGSLSFLFLHLTVRVPIHHDRSASNGVDMIQGHGASIDVSTEPRNECVFDIDNGADEDPVMQRATHESLLKRIRMHRV